MVKITAFGNNVLVDVHKAPKTTESGLIVPDSVKKDCVSGTVLSAGRDAQGILPGMVVWFNKYDGRKFDGDENGDVFILQVGQVLAIEEKEQTF